MLLPLVLLKQGQKNCGQKGAKEVDIRISQEGENMSFNKREVAEYGFWTGIDSWLQRYVHIYPSHNREKSFNI